MKLNVPLTVAAVPNKKDLKTTFTIIYLSQVSYRQGD